MKICSVCKIPKDEAEFYKNKAQPTGLHYECKTCFKKITSKHESKYKARRNELHRGYYKADPQKYIDKVKKWASSNREYVRVKDREYRKKFPDKFKNYDLKKNYGTTLEEKNRRFHLQGNKCAICKKAIPKERLRHFDHNHNTKELRGILCHGCNMILGFAKEDCKILLSAVWYLVNSPWREGWEKQS